MKHVCLIRTGIFYGRCCMQNLRFVHLLVQVTGQDHIIHQKTLVG